MKMKSVHMANMNEYDAYNRWWKWTKWCWFFIYKNISGAVLERMKNKAYICWCLLNELGFVDGAGSVVVHSTAALVSVWRLGIYVFP